MVAYQAPLPTVLQPAESQEIERILPRITTLLSSHEWISIDCLNWYHPTHMSRHPTIVISARDTTNVSWWSKTLPNVRQVIEEAGGGFEVVLLFLNRLHMQTSYPQDVSSPDASILATLYNKERSMGTSCGRLGSMRSGTLGGLIVVEKDGERINLGITNCHVLLHDAGLDLSSAIRPESMLEQLQVVSPSDEDRKSSKGSLKIELQAAEKKLKDLVKLYGEEELDEYQNKQLKDLKIRLALCDRNVALGKSRTRTIGTVYAASGYTTCLAPLRRSPVHRPHLHVPWALDWCLVQLKVGLSDKPYNPPHDGNISENISLKKWARFDPYEDYKVLKRGRSTGWTKGHINSNRSYLNGLTAQMDTVEDVFNKQLVAAHCIIARPCSQKGMFIRSGDSGSMVLMDKPSPEHPGDILGLCFASNESSNVSYMIPMDLLIHSIEAVTGGKVIQPQERTFSMDSTSPVGLSTT
ncbi:hypothetical protein EJ04DRAFT_528099 [Polyplosphaeria fusca]|uniref:Uncharacterized protein n=1 Tax=Polyplosphaeria fusca TaxID=682080 RepID=A0A9P4QPC8_9PLEO|nr:hypothetical protein EJ04DRAFT_528099 [Polyplosphaeria fusca]